MKRHRILGAVGIFFVITMLLVGTAMGEKYTVKLGDNLTKISKLTGYTIKQLVEMNEIKNPDHILIGQKIVFLNQEDFESARFWCEKRIKELPWGDLNYDFFVRAIEDIKNNHIRYSIDEYTGLHFSLILVFAKAWRVISEKRIV